MKIKDYIYFYSNPRGNSGAFDVRDIVSWSCGCSPGLPDWYVLVTKQNREIVLDFDNYKGFRQIYDMYLEEE